MKIKYLLAVATACMLVNAATPAMAAKAVPEPEDRTSNLTIIYTAEDRDEGTITNISGATFEITKVADLNWHGGSPEYVLLEEYEGLDISFDGMSASESQEAAKLLSEADKEPLAKGVTDKDGYVVFRDLEHGIYLVEETAKQGTAEEYSKTEAYLVMVPGYYEDGWVYEVINEPKTAPEKIVTPPVEEPEPEPEPNTPPQTGESLDAYIWTCVSGLAASVLVILMLIRRSRRKEETPNA